MHRIDNATAAAALPAPQPVGPNPDSFFQNQTIVGRDFMNAIQEEPCNFIEAMGITLDKTDNAQLLAALLLLRNSEWKSTGITPTHVDATSFTIPSDPNNEYHSNRRIKAILNGSYVVGTIVDISVGANITVTVELDSGALDATLTDVEVSRLRDDERSMPFHRIYMLPEPEVLTGSFVYGSWQTFTNATLANVNAKRAIVRIGMHEYWGAGAVTSADFGVWVRKPGVAHSLLKDNAACWGQAYGNSDVNLNDKNDVTVDINSNHEFQIYIAKNTTPAGVNPSVGAITARLVGYKN